MADKPRIRVPARTASAVAPNRARASYEGASFGDRALRWDSSSVSSYQSLRSSAYTLRGRSYKAYRNFTVARGAIHRQVDAIIGTGAVPRLKGVDPTFAKEVLALFNEWANSADADGATSFYGLQATTIAETLLGGDGLVRLRLRRPEDGMRVPLQLEVLSGDFLPETKEELNGQNAIRAGIEITPFGRRVAYHLYSSNPRDTSGTWRAPSAAMTTRIPAEQVCHIRLPGLSGQLRGEPLLSVALNKMADLDDYDDAELLRKRNAAALTGFIRRPSDGGASNLEGLSEDGGEGVGTLALEPGSFPVLAPGEEVTLAGTTDLGGQYESFLRWQLRFVAIGVGVPYEALTGDWSQGNDRTYRAARMEWRSWVDRVRWQCVEPQLLRPTWRAFVEAAALVGALPPLPPGMTVEALAAAVEWRFPKAGWINPLQEVQAYRAAIRAGIASRRSVLDEIGEDVEEIDAELAADQARADRFGLVFDIDARRVSQAGVTQARPAGTTDPNAPSLGVPDDDLANPPSET